MDIYSRKIVGYNVFHSESMESASLVVTEAAQAEKIDKNQLILHSDNGGAMKGATMLATLQKLGVVTSFSRPRVSNDNPYSESLFKTLKYLPQYPDIFNSIDETYQWVNTFVEWYNNQHFHSGIKYVTPSSRHNGLDGQILAQRKEVYRKARVENPNRWGSRNTRNWDKVEFVHLNYLQETKNSKLST